jgi:Putative mono-oxygenase ydhR
MHAVLITFQSAVSTDALADSFREYAEALRLVRGLISKTWIADGPTLGGFHIFESRADAENYLGGEMVAGRTANPAFTDFSINHFDVFDELSEITGTPQRVLRV